MTVFQIVLLASLSTAPAMSAQTPPPAPEAFVVAPPPKGPFPPLPPALTVGDFVWRRGPQTIVLERYVPAAAKRYGVEGRTLVECVVAASGGLTDCVVRSEEPAGFGFGAASLRAAAGLALRPTGPRGLSIVGQRVRQPFHWKMVEEAPTAPDCYAHLMAEELIAAGGDASRRERVARTWAARLAAARPSEGRRARETLQRLAAPHIEEAALLATPQARANAVLCRSLYLPVDRPER